MCLWVIYSWMWLPHLLFFICNIMDLNLTNQSLHNILKLYSLFAPLKQDLIQTISSLSNPLQCFPSYLDNFKELMSCSQIIWDFNIHFYFHMARMATSMMPFIDIHILLKDKKGITLLLGSDFVLECNLDQMRHKLY